MLSTGGTGARLAVVEPDRFQKQFPLDEEEILKLLGKTSKAANEAKQFLYESGFVEKLQEHGERKKEYKRRAREAAMDGAGGEGDRSGGVRGESG